ncbi:MAG: hypothetical protein LC126_06605 [Bryobacterales bacterium]|nr:hypothetical protein [Bryobacterales bacterium]
MRKLLVLFFAAALFASAAVKIEKVAWKGWPNCYRISNGEVELIVTSDIGPRIMRYAFVGGPNLFAEFAPQLGKSGEKEWMPRGGSRLWMSPEDKVKSYALDNSPIEAKVTGAALEATQAVEKETGLQKQIIVKLAPSGSHVEVIHRLRNASGRTLEYAPWVLTMMALNGTGITGFPPRGRHPIDLAPTNPLVMWPYTDLTDKRWIFTKKYLGLKQNPNNTEAQKIGMFNPNTWGAYLLGDQLFVKRYRADGKKTYPDFGCSYETFTNAEFLEIETVGPLGKVAPGAAAEHVEHWSLHRGVRLKSWTDAELDRVLLPLLK